MQEARAKSNTALVLKLVRGLFWLSTYGAWNPQSAEHAFQRQKIEPVERMIVEMHRS